MEADNSWYNINYRKLRIIANKGKWNESQLYNPNILIELLLLNVFNSRQKKIDIRNNSRVHPEN